MPPSDEPRLQQASAAGHGPLEGAGGDAPVTLVRLKGNVKRTVFVERRAGLAPVLVKRFHAPGWSRLRDRARAASEARALRRAAALGLPVPEVLSVDREAPAAGRGDGARGPRQWTLRMGWIEDARPLDRVLAAHQGHGPHGPGPSRLRLARRLGELLAAVERAGLLHPDPHPGNVLIDRTGQPWLVDLARTRFGASRSRVLAGFERAVARVRESSSPGFRAAAHLAWRSQGGSGFDDVEAVERRAVARRRDEVAARVAVWSRDSSATRIHASTEGGREVLVRALEDQQPRPGWQERTLEGDLAECLAAWDTLVRASVHGLRAAKPRRLRLDAPHRVTFDVPPGEVLAGPIDAHLEAGLRDRGLALRPCALVIDRSGRSCIHPSSRLVSDTAR